MNPESHQIAFGSIVAMTALMSFAIFALIESRRKRRWTSRLLAAAFFVYVAVFIGRNFNQHWPPVFSPTLAPAFAWIIAFPFILGGGLFLFLRSRRTGR